MFKGSIALQVVKASKRKPFLNISNNGCITGVDDRMLAAMHLVCHITRKKSKKTGSIGF